MVGLLMMLDDGYGWTRVGETVSGHEVANDHVLLEVRERAA